MKANEAEKILRESFDKLSEPLKSAIAVALANWKKIEDGAEEEWRNVIGFDGHYQVSNFGRVKSFKWGVEKILKPNCSKDSYPRISLYQNGELKKVLVHVLVAKACIPNPNNLPVVNHIDNVRSNNRVENLEWVTYSENQKHAVRIGARKIPRGAKHPLSKLTQEEADEIRKVHISAHPEYGAKALAEKYDVTLRTIYRILHNKSYVE